MIELRKACKMKVMKKEFKKLEEYGVGEKKI